MIYQFNDQLWSSSKRELQDLLDCNKLCNRVISINGLYYGRVFGVEQVNLIKASSSVIQAKKKDLDKTMDKLRIERWEKDGL